MIGLKHWSVVTVLLDFAKAFDSVPHQRLLLKLQSLGVSGKLLDWNRCFLTTRSQRVVVMSSIMNGFL